MTLRQALTLLGVELEDAPESVRRAYLRQLKQCRPDDDPDAFMRLRSAYEAVATYHDSRSDGGETANPTSWLSAPPALSVPMGQLAFSAPPSTGDPGESQGPGWDNQLDQLQPFVARMNLLSPFDALNRLTIARQAVEELNESPAAHHLLAECLANAHRDDERRDLLEKCHKQGMPGFLDYLVAGYPSSLSEQEVRDLRQSEGLGALSALAIGWVSEGQSERAIQLVEECLERLEMSDPANVTGLSVLLSALLFLMGEGDGTEGRRLLQRFGEIASQMGGELELLKSSDELTQWAFARELADLPDNFPAAVAGAMARGAAKGDPSSAFDELDEVFKSKPYLTERAAELIESSNLLHHFYHHVLVGPTSSTYSGVQVGSGGLWFLLLFTLFQLSRCAQ
ncbi:MAG: J domain-containing protein [Thermoanaerobaculia bacterium]|nr:J domain-containing protein [Thermoanaerobaculia bacterium]